MDTLPQSSLVVVLVIPIRALVVEPGVGKGLGTVRITQQPIVLLVVLVVVVELQLQP